MSYSNNGTVYVELSCDIPSSIDWNPENNNGSQYFYKEPNDFILWGQDTLYQHPSSNNGTQYYFYVCNKPTDVNWNSENNNGTAFYYNSAFNCVKFCEGGSSILIPDPGYVFVYHINGDQVFTNNDLPVQVPEEYAND
jgi:hypothetical protein